jgi:DNA-binding response OmpR family regulator
LAGEKIMIVDDEAVVHELLTHYLEREGFRVFSVYSGTMSRRKPPSTSPT